MPAASFNNLTFLDILHYRDQINKNKPGRALKLMAALPDFHGAFVKLVQDEAYKEGSNILLEKDIPRKEFNMNCLKSFSYNDQLGKDPLELSISVTFHFIST